MVAWRVKTEITLFTLFTFFRRLSAFVLSLCRRKKNGNANKKYKVFGRARREKEPFCTLFIKKTGWKLRRSVKDFTFAVISHRITNKHQA